MKSKFEKWFEMQYGKRPSKKDLSDLSTESASLARQYAIAERLYQQTKRWDEDWITAQRGWNAAFYK